MLKVVDYIRTKAISDPSMATVLRMIEENAGLTEDCILAAFQSIYEANQNLAQELLKAKRETKPKLVKPPGKFD